MGGTEVSQRHQHGECVQCGKQVSRLFFTGALAERFGSRWGRWQDFYSRDWCVASPEDLGECVVPVILEGPPPQ